MTTATKAELDRMIRDELAKAKIDHLIEEDHVQHIIGNAEWWLSRYDHDILEIVARAPWQAMYRHVNYRVRDAVQRIGGVEARVGAGASPGMKQVDVFARIPKSIHAEDLVITEVDAYGFYWWNHGNPDDAAYGPSNGATFTTDDGTPVSVKYLLENVDHIERFVRDCYEVAKAYAEAETDDDLVAIHEHPRVSGWIEA